MTFLRPALNADGEELARFECGRPERQFEIDVQEFVRDAVSWLEEPEGVDRELLVLEDSGEIVGIVMHEDDDGNRSSMRCDSQRPTSKVIRQAGTRHGPRRSH